MNSLILKSASPRRKEILEFLGLKFKIEPSHLNESEIQGEKPLDYLKRVTIHKLEKGKSLKWNTYISSDTIVVIGDRILQKPKDFNEGMEMISKLSGNKHFVYSGIGILTDEILIYDFDCTEILFYPLSEMQIKEYLVQYKPYDKAGGYGIQDGYPLVKSYDGSYQNVVGFPIRKFLKYIQYWQEFL